MDFILVNLPIWIACYFAGIGTVAALSWLDDKIAGSRADRARANQR